MLSVIHYLKSILKDMVPVGPLSGYASDIPLTTTVVC